VSESLGFQDKKNILADFHCRFPFNNTTRRPRKTKGSSKDQ